MQDKGIVVVPRYCTIVVVKLQYGKKSKERYFIQEVTLRGAWCEVCIALPLQV